jgi:acyl-CoA synthetase (AMP-forming)/AMP-acid ligase II
MSTIISRLSNYGRDGLRVPVRGVDVAKLLLPYTNLLELLPSSSNAAIIEPLSLEKKPLTHGKLKQFVFEEFDLTQFGIPTGSRVAVLLPNGAELAVAIISVISRWCAAPINPTNTWQEIKAELESTKAIAMIILAGATSNEAALQAAKALGTGVFVITPDSSVSGLFRISQLIPMTIPTPEPIAANKSNIVMLLHTSGTSGNKKLVPYSLEMIVVGVGCIISSWNLSPSDICLNMMPLFHIGGIVRNILSPILSGGSVITCSGFDPVLFWDILYSSTQRFTWYYAAPTMHHAILMEAEKRCKPWPVDSVRFLANAAGGLLPILAESLRNTFEATILTSYGMTEW